MKKLEETNNGYLYAKVSRLECLSWGGMGMCDFCGKDMDEGYLVFVLHSCICPECFNTWIGRSKKYEDDLNYQDERADGWFKAYLGSSLVYPEGFSNRNIRRLQKKNNEILKDIEKLDKVISDGLKDLLSKDSDKSA
ncbi:MAG: hypothetical protein J6T15_04860 [Bacilli bacterium]|nr:hypothetical protein [Bacilli bacterium]